MDIVEISDSDASEDTIIITPPTKEYFPDLDIEDIASKYLGENPDEKLGEKRMELDSDDDLPSINIFKYSPAPESKSEMILDHLKRKYNRKSSLEEEELKQKELKEKELKLEKVKAKQLQKEESEREKALRKAQEATNKNMKRGECMKFITVLFDNGILEEPYASSLIQEIQSADISYKIQSQIVSNLFTWTREVQSHLMNDEGKLILSSENNQTEDVLITIKCKEFVEFVAKDELSTHMQSIRSLLQDKKIFLVVYGMREYFRYWKNEKQREFRSQIAENDRQKLPKGSKFYTSLPKISRKNAEYALTELELLHKVSHRFIDNPADFSSTLIQFTKAIAQKPYKAQQADKYQNVEWFAPGDNKNCVKVAKDGIGLKRLWNQTMTMFPLVRLETAEAIIQKYPNPRSLWEAYDFCTSEKEKELLLHDIQIRRAAGPLSSVRRIGPELSKKIYKFYTSIQGETLL